MKITDVMDNKTYRVLDSALKAFLSGQEDCPVGVSYSMMNNILDRLVKSKPLTELTGEDGEWINTTPMGDEPMIYQNKRCSSVFKYVYPDGRVDYKDIDRFICVDINNGSKYHSGRVEHIAERFIDPVTMPYYPPVEPMSVYTEDFLFDAVNGDYDTVGVLYLRKADPHKEGDMVEIDVYQKQEGYNMVEISREEYLDRRKNAVRGVRPSRLESVQKEVDKLQKTGPLSDGYHTFDELYYHRMMLFSIICNTYKSVSWKSWKHADGSMYDDMFIVGVSLPSGDYSYHYHSEFWDRFNIKELPNAPEWDGHMPGDIDRLRELVE